MIYFTLQGHHKCHDGIEGYTEDQVFSDDLAVPGGDLKWRLAHHKSPVDARQQPAILWCPFCGEKLPWKAPEVQAVPDV